MSPIDIKVETRTEGDWSIIDVAGEVDVFTAPKLREQILSLVGHGANHLVVNLDGVEFMDSTGLGVLVGGLKRLRERDGKLALAGAHGTVLRVLNITGLDSVFALHETVEDATRS